MLSLEAKKKVVSLLVWFVILSAFASAAALYYIGSNIGCVGVLLIILASPKWLPGRVVRMRMMLLTRINNGSNGSGEGFEVPSKEIDSTEFKYLYKQRSAHGRSEGAALSDLFWYFLSPGPEVHQEQVENGEKYEAINAISKQLLALSQERTEELILKYGEQYLNKTVKGATFVHLRDYYMPLFAKFFHEVVFGDEGDDEAIEDIVAFATNVIETLKWVSLRDMPRRLKVTEYARKRIMAGDLQANIPDGLTLDEVVLSVQGGFLNTAVVQSSEAMAHATLAMASHPEEAKKLAQCEPSDKYTSCFINEVFRLWPLFGIAHRITTEEISLKNGKVLPRGAVVCFNYPAYHGEGYENGHVFDPSRWDTLRMSQVNHVPFGVAGNRPCPAQRLAGMYLNVLCPFIARRVTPISVVEHTRSLPGRGFCMLQNKGTERLNFTIIHLLAYMWLYEQVDCVFRSLRQFFCAFVIVREAQSLRLCDRFFKSGQKMLPINQEFATTPRTATES
eukprot:TRINITY_DN7018_c0_g1_i3.p1 TRINITY_DN7018_c0_g1~~TRINITY_DN7018_c0_g1_i3.p1  ORF type:complete len:505 (+),score=101.24 TRINITY_DN7018_c0_g1_i3:54-1568(+)